MTEHKDKRSIAVSAAIDNLRSQGEDITIDKRGGIACLFEYYSNKTLEDRRHFINSNNISGSVMRDLLYKAKFGYSYKDFYKSKEWISLSKAVKDIYGRVCMKCGKSSGVFHSDHIIPRSKNIDLELDINNIQVLCEDCNISKSNSESVDYRTMDDIEKLNRKTNKKYHFERGMHMGIDQWVSENRNKKLSKDRIETLLGILYASHA